VLYVAGYLIRLSRRLRNNESGSYKETYLAAPALLLDLKGSLALILSRLYKNKTKPFA
jgi:hypothetical protein